MQGPICFLIAFLLSFSSFAKDPHALCANDIGGADFSSGDGTEQNPYLICNYTQLDRVGEESALLTKFFVLGSDISYSNHVFKIIGSKDAPFKGGFDGNGYNLSSVVILRDRENYLAPFGYIVGARLENISIGGVSFVPDGNEHVAGLVGYASNSKLTNLHVDSVNMTAASFSGALAGELNNCELTHSSSNGAITHIAGTKAGGGLVGYAKKSDISACSSEVFLYTNSPSADVSAIGNLIGHAKNSNIHDVYAIAAIDYRNTVPTSLKQAGGLIGLSSGSTLNRAYYAGRILLVSDEETIGAAVGAAKGKNVFKKIFWNSGLAGRSNSAAGIGMTGNELSVKAFWLSNGFDETIWDIIDGRYPILRKIR